MNLNFTISELIHSDTAVRYRINNMPDITSLDNMLELICKCLQPLRDRLKSPIIVTNGYRSAELWQKLKEQGLNPARNSQHLKGQAADLMVRGMSQEELFHFVRTSGIEYDQLIWEQDNDCVHVSYVKGRNRRQAMVRNNGLYTIVHATS